MRTPGTCGEFLQGSIDGQSFLVTCPINRYSYAIGDVKHGLPTYYTSLQPKALKARLAVLKLLGIPLDEAKPIYVRSDIVQGKGMASSSADISVAAMATAVAHGYELSMHELEQICLSIEPSDAAFHPAIVQFDYRHGKISEVLGTCPPMKILIFDEGGMVDTVAFNGRSDLPKLIAEKEELITEALAKFKEGIRTHNMSLMGEASTISAFGNQRILPKPSLYDFHQLGIEFNSLGTIIAHSGTIMGLLFPSDDTSIHLAKTAIVRELPHLTYIDTVETTNEGITYMKR